MTPAQFTRALQASRLAPEGRTAAAARLVLVDGMSRNAAARQIGIDIRAVSKGVDKLQPRPRCPHCHGTGFRDA